MEEKEASLTFIGAVGLLGSWFYLKQHGWPDAVLLILTVSLLLTIVVVRFAGLSILGIIISTFSKRFTFASKQPIRTIKGHNWSESNTTPEPVTSVTSDFELKVARYVDPVTTSSQECKYCGVKIISSIPKSYCCKAHKQAAYRERKQKQLVS